MFRKTNSIMLKKTKKRSVENDDEDPLEKLKFLMGNKQPETEIEKNHLYFYSDVTQETCLDLTRKINNLNKELLKYSIEYDCPPPSIFLHINSLGGDLLSAFGVVDTIENSRIPIISIVHGQSASAATIISMSCHKRYMTSNSFMLIHQLSTGIFGKFEELKDDFENDISFMDTLYSLYKKHTKMDLKTIKESLKHDLWWNSEKCIDSGLVDSIWSPHITTLSIQNVFKENENYETNSINKQHNNTQPKKKGKNSK